MRKAFFEYYRPTAEEFERLWKECTFALDANLLLDLYRYSPASRRELVGILEGFRERLWVPHQAAFEYHENRFGVIATAFRPYLEIQRKVTEIRAQLTECGRQHPFITKEIGDSVSKYLDDMIDELNEAHEKHPDLLKADTVGDEIAALLAGRVGPSYSSDRRGEIIAEGEDRYLKKIPPGFMDAKKTGERQYGDLFLWFQLIDHAVVTKKPIVLVTRDKKPDWWLEQEGKTLLPRPELRNEFNKKTRQDFYLYDTSQFIEYAKAQLELKVSQELISEVKELEGPQALDKPHATVRFDSIDWDAVIASLREDLKKWEVSSHKATDVILVDEDKTGGSPKIGEGEESTKENKPEGEKN